MCAGDKMKHIKCFLMFLWMWLFTEQLMPDNISNDSLQLFETSLCLLEAWTPMEWRWRWAIWCWWLDRSRELSVSMARQISLQVVPRPGHNINSLTALQEFSVLKCINHYYVTQKIDIKSTQRPLFGCVSLCKCILFSFSLNFNATSSHPTFTMQLPSCRNSHPSRVVLLLNSPNLNYLHRLPICGYTFKYNRIKEN